MAGLVILMLGALIVSVGLLSYGWLKYGLPVYLEYKENKEEREYEKELQEQEQIDALVEEAEQEYGNGRN